jgi:hypothetical protein
MDIVTKEIKIAKNINYLSKILPAPIHTLRYRLSVPGCIFQYVIKYLTDFTPWPTFTEDQINIYRVMVNEGFFNNHGHGYKLTNLNTREIKWFTSTVDVAKFLNLAVTTIIKKVNNFPITNDWIIEAISLQCIEEPLLNIV